MTCECDVCGRMANCTYVAMSGCEALVCEECCNVDDTRD
jgi:hypothetical protein